MTTYSTPSAAKRQRHAHSHLTIIDITAASTRRLRTAKIMLDAGHAPATIANALGLGTDTMAQIIGSNTGGDASTTSSTDMAWGMRL